jgi:hypothetical protein
MLTERYADALVGVISCFDRLLIQGTLPDIAHAQAMTRYLNSRQMRIFDFTQFAQPLRERIRDHAVHLAETHGLTIEFIRHIKAFRKEDRVQAIVAERGTHPGLVHIFSAMESCSSFKPWHDKRSGKTFIKPDTGRCLHYYFYFIDPELGLCHLRVPTWAPFRLQFCLNGHQWLAARLKRHGIDYKLLDNAFLDIADFARAQALADRMSAKTLHRKLDQYTRRCCPVVDAFPAGYHWSLNQVEYATDIIFKRVEDLAPLYDTLVRTAVHAVRAEQVATFLGRKLDPRYLGEVGNDFTTRIQGTRIRHQMGKSALKMYDKFGRLLRIEAVSNDVSFFKHHRTVEHRNGTRETKLAPVKKSIYSLGVLREVLGAATRRYVEFVSTLDDPTSGRKHLERLSRPVRDATRSYKGLNFFDPLDSALLLAVVRGEFNLRGFQVRDLRRLLPHLSGAQLSRMVKRLRMHRLLKKIRGTYRYYLTRAGRRVIAAALQLREACVIPALATNAA